jgi:alpha-L-fucosidase
LRDFHHLLETTFAHNLAENGTVIASNQRGNDSRFSGQNVVSGKPDAYWATDDGITNGELVIEMPAPVTFTIVRLREFLPLGQRVEAFALDQWQNGAWVQFGTGTSVGNCRLVRCPPITTTRVRLRILKSPVSPAIAELGLFAGSP